MWSTKLQIHHHLLFFFLGLQKGEKCAQEWLRVGHHREFVYECSVWYLLSTWSSILPLFLYSLIKLDLAFKTKPCKSNQLTYELAGLTYEGTRRSLFLFPHLFSQPSSTSLVLRTFSSCFASVAGTHHPSTSSWVFWVQKKKMVTFSHAHVFDF